MIVYTDSWEGSRNNNYDSREFGMVVTVIDHDGECACRRATAKGD